MKIVDEIDVKEQQSMLQSRIKRRSNILRVRWGEYWIYFGYLKAGLGFSKQIIDLKKEIKDLEILQKQDKKIMSSLNYLYGLHVNDCGYSNP